MSVAVGPSLVSLDPLVLLPVLAPALGVLLVLVVDAAAPRLRGTHFAVGMAALLLGAGGALPAALAGAPRSTLCRPGPDATCLYVTTASSGLLQLAALVASALVLLLLWPGGDRGTRWSDELAALRGGPALLVALVLATAAGAVAVAGAQDLATWLIALEVATLPVIALVALRGSALAGSASLALLTTSLFSFALLVLGAALWVVATGSATFGAAGVRSAWAGDGTRAVLLLAVLLLLAGLGFKLSAVPFHLWTPQAYSASREPVAALLATTSKLAAVAALVVLLRPLTEVSLSVGGLSAVGTALAVLAAVSMTLGNVVALGQDDPVRLLAWSTVAQAGWVLLPLASLTAGGVAAGAGYAVVYALGTLVVFAVVATVHARRPDRPENPGRPGPVGPRGRSLAAYRGLARTDPLLAGALMLGLLTLAGLPPGVLGLLAKVFALRPVVDAGLWWLVVVAVGNAVLGIAVYARWVAVLVAPRGDRLPVGPPVAGVRVAVVAGSAVLAVTSVAPQLVLGLLG